MGKVKSNENIMNLRDSYRTGGLLIDNQSACVFCNYIPALEKMYKITESFGIDEPKVVRYIRRLCRVLNKLNISRSPSVILGTALYFSKEFNQITSAQLVGTTTLTLRTMKNLLRYWYYFWREEDV